MKNFLSKCRLCGSKINSSSIYSIKNSPSIIQNLPKSQIRAKSQKLTLQIAQCSNCNLTQLTNKPVSYYKSVIRASGISASMSLFKKKQIKSFSEKFNLNNDAKVCEIGCGSGEYLKILNNHFIDPLGLEFDNAQIANCKENGLKVRKGFISNQSYKVNNHKFDAFFIFNFLEHIPSPITFLKGIANNLKPKAFGIIEVPNYDFMLRNNISYDYTPEHLSYFTKQTLNKMLTISGLNVISIREVWHGHILEAIVSHKKEEVVHQKKTPNKNTLFENIDKLVDLEYKDGFVVWGACHHSFFILSQIKNSKKIKFIVDSAAHKVNRYSPVSAIKINHPEELNIYRPKSLLIMASSYSAEVVKIAKKKYKCIKNLYLLDGNLIKKIA